MAVPVPQRISLPQLSARDRGDVSVVSLRGELDFAAVSALRAYLSDIRWRGRPRCVADLTGLAFIGGACLGVLVRHGTEIRAQDGSFALAGPQGAVHRVLSVTGLLTWFEVHDTVGQAVAGARRSLVSPAASSQPRITGAGALSVRPLASARAGPHPVSWPI